MTDIGSDHYLNAAWPDFTLKTVIPDAGPTLTPLKANQGFHPAVYQVTAHFWNGAWHVGYGTAFCFADGRLATAGHVLFDSRVGGYARQIQVQRPGTTGGRAVLDRDFFVPEPYSQTGGAELDAGLIMAAGLNPGKILPIEVFDTAATPLETSVEVVGYPAPQMSLWGHRRYLTGSDQYLLYHHVDTVEGMSGGPLVLSAAGRAIGIHSRGIEQPPPHGVPRSNCATRLTQPLANWLHQSS